MTEVQKKIWNEMLDSEMNSIYFQSLANGFSRWEFRIKVFLAITASGSAIAGWAIWHDVAKYPYSSTVWTLASSLAAIVAIIHPFLNNAKKLEWATSLRIAYEATTQDYEILWLQRNDLKEAKLLTELEKLIHKERHLSSLESHLPETDSKLLAECQSAVIKRRGL